MAAKKVQQVGLQKYLTPEEHQKKQCQKKQDQARTTHFCVGFTKIPSRPISVILRNMKKKHKLSWLCPKMSHHKFTNLGDMFNADLTTKVM